MRKCSMTTIKFYSFKTDPSTRGFAPLEIIRDILGGVFIQCELWFAVFGMLIEKEKNKK